MSDRVVFLFPGQGAYLPGVFARLGVDSGRIMNCVAEIDAAAEDFGYKPVEPLLFSSDAPALGSLLRSDHERLDVATLATSIAFAQLLEEKWEIRPDHVMGHSLGEFAALAVAGVLTPAAATRAVCERHAALRKAPPPPGGMLAVNVGPVQAKELIASAGARAVAVSAHNSPEQTVVSGDEIDLAKVQNAAEKAGIRRSRLRVASSFHVPQLTDASELYAAALRTIPRSAPRERVFFSHGLGRYLTAADDIVDLMVRDMIRPVRFHEAVRALHDDGVTTFVECGPLDILNRIVPVILPTAITVAPLRQVLTAAELTSLLGPLLPQAAGDAGPAQEKADTRSVTHTDAEILETVRTVCAELLEYPVEVITDTADFTADLGADSLTLSELLERSLQRYGLEDRFHEGDPAGYSTVAELAAFVAGLVRERVATTAGQR
ncbi:acyltransferase domain-containing protein [Solwaraspora sp. WMMD1047]|uniref:acyltransferase domain-containing protein n=1 Tax=Solwaraspora sp. WMMD1047 TaxID=3016102 RepID=UPI00241631CE|nr:acyltransferase domain-containing protein [Solwaraspora sp. WMMD1047]MDG4830638.1 acyltransferase domain-containing protein [Solwaraspora sp. WMMD1047]